MSSNSGGQPGGQEQQQARLALVVAVSENGVIGKANALPWRLPSELKLFRQRTLGHPVIMGRRTFESIGKPLQGRDNIVVTRGEVMEHEDVLTANSIEEALALAQRLAQRRGVDEIFIIGGSQIFAATRKLAQRIYLTRVHANVEGDAHFPDPEPDRWREISREKHTAQEKDSADFTIITYERR